MARPRSDNRLLIAKWKKILSALKPKETFNMSQFAELIGMSRVNFRKTYLNPDPNFPIEVTGAEGKDYQINGKKAVTHLIKRAEERLLIDDKKAQRVAELAGLAPDEVEHQGLSIAEIRDLNRIQGDIHKRRIEQGLYVPKEDHARIVADLCMMAGSQWHSVASELDADGRWPEHIRNLVTDFADRAASELFDKFGQYLGKFETNVANDGKARKRAGTASKRKPSRKSVRARKGANKPRSAA